MNKGLSRRTVGAGLLGFGMVAASSSRTRPVAPACTQGVPDWVAPLRTNLERMAKDLTATLKPWNGPKRIVTPEQSGYAGQGPATRYIQAAIDAAAKLGGGTVRLTKGDYVTGTLDLKSHIRLEVAKGARLLGSLDLKDYPERIAKRPTVMDSNMGMNQSLIFAEGCENISIAGAGVIDGRGSMANFPGDETIHGTPGRPFLMRIIDCRRIHISGITLKDSPCWMQNYLNCDDLLIERMTVDNQANFNNDGLDIDGCRRVIVRNCYISSGDDAICFKGASLRPTQNVLIENCKLYSSCNALKLGTDSQSLFENVLVRHCEIGGVSEAMRHIKPTGADSGISWEIVDGGTAQNILATDIHIVRARSPLFMRLENRGRVRPEQPKPPVGHLRRVVFERITGADNGSRGSYFIGIPEKHIEDVVLKDIKITAKASTDWLKEDQIPEMRGVYPDAHMIDKQWGGLGKGPDGQPIGGDAPAYGLWTRHVSGLTLISVNITTTTPDPRPAFLLKTDVRACIV